ncbi:Synaptotagmin-4 [Heracleum sosnowskyi]|uniref:Synaptotagmin-4 n=1 Tax=Heracleum sosnowskyi TaxID=360622 RepID=A0AAD8HPR2_9APIA|nr:Synaptotagmin-4 [Heracleum sosnowskyi]
MSFSVAFVFGFAVGIGLVLGFARFGRTRSKQRTDLAAIVAAFARITVADTRKLLPAEYYPSWVVFSKLQKLNWLNQHLDKIWPYVDQATSELIRSSVEPMLEDYRPSVLAALKFSKLTLGTVAPQFTGVTIIEGDAKAITMELELQWDGNPNIVLDIRTHLGVGLPIQVKNIGFTGVFRFLFKPLVDEIPCFGAISFSLRENRNLDFKLKVIGGDISTIPGISEAIEETIRDAIEDSITWPVRQVIPIIPGDYSYLELKPVGTLEVKLVQAKELTNKDIIGKSDPFAVLFIRPVRSRMKTSKIVNNNLNPIWNENFEFIVEDETTQHLTVRVFDDEGVQAAEIIGCAQLPLKELEPGKVKDVWLKLVKDVQVQRDKKNRGQVQLELLYCPNGTENALTNAFRRDFRLTKLEKALKTEPDEKEDTDPAKLSAKRKDVILRGVLSVTVISAEDLPAVDLNGKSDPFVILIMKKTEEKKKTRVVHNTLDPVWNQTFDFVVEDALHDLLLVEVYDHDTFGKDKMGRVVMTLTRVTMEGELTELFPIDGTNSGKINLHLKWTSQPIFRD